MTLEEYINGLNELVKENPEAKDFEVVSAVDAEGNGFNKVYWGPSLGIFRDSEFQSLENLEEDWDDDDGDLPKLNAVCIN